MIKILAESKPKRLFFVVNGKEENLQKLLDSFEDPPFTECTVLHLNAVPFYIKNVSYVLMEAKAVFSNGTAFAESGSASIALAAKEYNVPVGFYCESFRFTERVQLDSIVFNDIGFKRQCTINFSVFILFFSVLLLFCVFSLIF